MRNFSTDPKNFSVSRYTSSRLQTEVGLSRQRMVVMALLLGCDYNLGGVAGVGREAVTRLFSVWAEGSLGREAGSLVNSTPCTAGCVDTRAAWRVTDWRVRHIKTFIN